VGLSPVVLVPPICYLNIKSIKSSYIPEVEDFVVPLVVKSIKFPVTVVSSVVWPNRKNFFIELIYRSTLFKYSNL